MASVNKVKIEDATYDISPSPNGTLDTTSTTKFTSNDVDQASANEYAGINKIDATETNSSIFSKLTSMVRNTRYLHNKVGTTDISDVGSSVTDAIAALNTKVPAHSHTTADLPVSGIQVNSSSYIPTSALIYSMNQTLTSLNNAVTLGKDIITNVDCGGIKAGTSISSSDTLQSIVKDMIYIPVPSTEYESINIGTWSSLEDVNNFFTSHTPKNGWAGLNLGNYVTINDGTYNTQWEIAGFNCEHNQLAADDSTYDNGYGICMIPKTALFKIGWNDTGTIVGGYKASTMHTSHLVTVANNLKTVLGDHLILRNVLLSSECNGTYHGQSTYPVDHTASAYEWTTAYATLMSVGQMTGTFASHNNKYDDGEANYKLPVFDYEGYTAGNAIYCSTRCVYGSVHYSSGPKDFIWYVQQYNISQTNPNGYMAVRPLIYLR